MNICAVHEDGTDCGHEGAPHMETSHGPALCAGGVRVTHVRIAGQLTELGAAVTAVQSAAAALTAAMTPAVRAAAAFARALTDDPRVRALAAAGLVLEDAEVAERLGDPGEDPPPGEAFDPCGNGTLKRLPGEVPLPFTVSLHLPSRVTPALPWCGRLALRRANREGRGAQAGHPCEPGRRQGAPGDSPARICHPPACLPLRPSWRAGVSPPSRDPAWTVAEACRYFAESGVPVGDDDEDAERRLKLIIRALKWAPASRAPSREQGGVGAAMYPVADLMRLHSALAPWIVRSRRQQPGPPDPARPDR